MHHIIYLSRAVGQSSPLELIALLEQSRRSNERVGVTGALVYGEGYFMQVLEGEEKTIQTIYARIVRDPRHRDIIKLADKPIKERTFTDWSMAFRELSPAQMATLEGYVSPAQWEQASFDDNSADSLLLWHMREMVLMRGAE